MTDQRLLPASGRLSRIFTWRTFLLGALFFTILGAKFHMIDRYGSDLPFWDQWDAEADQLYRPYLEGHLTAADWFAAHNEHRLVVGRALDLGLFIANGKQWDPRLEMEVNAGLHALVALVIVGLALRALPGVIGAGYAVIAAFFFTMAVSWENTLSGFQSQFYFLLLFTALHLGGTLLAKPGSWAWRLAPLAGVAALLSMASSLLSSLAILGAIGLRALRERTWSRGDGYVVGTNVVLVILGWLTKVEVPWHAGLKAPNLEIGVKAWLYQLAWPITAHPAAAVLGLAPPVVLGLLYLFRRADGPLALTLLAAAGWYWLQAAAIAYARGAVGHGYASRYTDILAVGVLINLLILASLAAHAVSTRYRYICAALATVFTIVTLWGIRIETRKAYDDTLQHLPAVNAARTAAVRGYITNHDPDFIHKKPWWELPYPVPSRLKQLLDLPVVQDMLPPSIGNPSTRTPSFLSRLAEHAVRQKSLLFGLGALFGFASLTLSRPFRRRP